MTAMMEALEYTVELINQVGTIDDDDPLEMIFQKCKQALAAPRNCEIGTAEEQSERFKSFCNSHMYGFNDPSGHRCKEDCPVKMEIDNRSDKLCIYCQFVWAQMPYEKVECDGK